MIDLYFWPTGNGTPYCDPPIIDWNGEVVGT
jgi:hypothetical protein